MQFWSTAEFSSISFASPSLPVHHYAPKDNNRDVHHHHTNGNMLCVTQRLAGGRGIPPRDALQHVFAYGVGVDLTRRDMQRAAKKAGRPWDCSKVRALIERQRKRIWRVSACIRSD